MAFKIVAALAFVGVASAYVVLIPQPSAAQPAPLTIIQEKNPLPQYTYTYGVHDSISGDSKSAIETRTGDVVKGEYSLNDADGFKRTVTYTADDLNGFQAVVDRKPIVNATADFEVALKASAVPLPAPFVINNRTPVNNTVSSIVHGAPILYFNPLTNGAPLTYSAPQLISSAPITYSSPALLSSVPATYVDHKPTISFIGSPSVPVTHVPSSPYIVVNSLPVAQ